MIRIEWSWAGDVQMRPALAECDCCSHEIYNERESAPDGHGHVYCAQCRAELEAEDGRAEAALAVLEAVDAELKKYLSDQLRDDLWNTMARRFRLPKEA